MDVSDLDRLIEAVDGGDCFGIIPMTQAALTPHEYSNPHGDRVARAFDGSLDAAKALKCSLLPNWKWGSVDHGDGEYGAGVGVSEFDEFVSTSNFSEARASLLAILKAHRAQQETEQ